VPDAAIAAGMLAPASRAARIGFALERFVCRHVDHVGVICEGFRTNLTAKGVPTDKIELLPNYVDLEFMRPVERRNSFRHEHGIGDDEFVIAYSGSIALKQGLQVFVEAAARMACEPRVRCLLIGDGPYLSDLQDSADKLGARNLTFLPLQPREQLPMQLGAADALLITQRKAVNDCVFPGKLLYYMAAGRPILAAVSEQSETGRFIKQHRVGIVTPPEEPEALVEGVSSLRADPGGAAEMGRNGREIAEQMFDRRRVLDRFEKVLSGLAA
jgi:colanic acid biosynthesis glycosyl transferase WcaI